MARQLTSWSPAKVITDVKTLYAAGADLRDGNAQREYRQLYRAAGYHLGSWRKTLAKSGIKYKDVRKAAEQRRRNEQFGKLQSGLLAAYNAGVDLSVTGVLGSEYEGLYWLSKHFYRGRTAWENCLSGVGIDPKQVVRQEKWTSEKVSTELDKLKKEGVPLNHGALRSRYHGLTRAMRRHYEGGYRGALKENGVDPQKVMLKEHRYAEGQVATEILAYNARGIDLSPGFINSKKNKDIRLRRLYYAAVKLHNGWWNALRKFGIDTSQISLKERWTSARVAEEIKRRYEEGEDLSVTALQKDNLKLVRAGNNHYGTWENAITAAGLDYTTISKQGPSLTQEEILAKIQEMAQEGKGLDVSTILDDSSIEVRRLFIQGSRKFETGWKGAIEAAGLNYDDIRKRRKPYTLQELMENVKQLHTSGKNLEDKIAKTDPDVKTIYSAVKKRFSSWYDFLEDTGIDCSGFQRQTDWKGGEGVKEALRERFPFGVVCGLRTGEKSSESLSQAAFVYFGGTEAAAKAAGLVYSRSGRITTEMMQEDPEILGKIFKCNEPAIKKLSEKVFWWCKTRGISSIESDDLVQESFLALSEVLPRMPYGASIESYVGRELFRRLVKVNRAHHAKVGNEVLFGEEAYFDAFGGDMDEFRELGEMVNRGGEVRTVRAHD